MHTGVNNLPNVIAAAGRESNARPLDHIGRPTDSATTPLLNNLGLIFITITKHYENTK